MPVGFSVWLCRRWNAVARFGAENAFDRPAGASCSSGAQGRGDETTTARDVRRFEWPPLGKIQKERITA
jgi:hypothetical protein